MPEIEESLFEEYSNLWEAFTYKKSFQFIAFFPEQNINS